MVTATVDALVFAAWTMAYLCRLTTKFEWVLLAAVALWQRRTLEIAQGTKP